MFNPRDGDNEDDVPGGDSEEEGTETKGAGCREGGREGGRGGERERERESN